MSTTYRMLDTPTTALQRGVTVPKLRARPRRLRTTPWTRLAKAAQHRGVEEDLRSSSLLDEARRRVKRNVGQIEAFLRLEDRREYAVSTEAVLADLTRRLQSMAAYQRTVCRSGQFDDIDLAVFLKEATMFLSRSTGRGADRGAGSRGGWVLNDSDRTLSWIRSDLGPERQGPGVDLGSAISPLPADCHEAIRRAVCACAVVFPPGLFSWRTPPSRSTAEELGPAILPGDLWIRLGPAGAGWRIDVSIDERGLGLPPQLDSKQKEKMELALTSLLARLVDGGGINGPDIGADFSVALVSREGPLAG